MKQFFSGVLLCVLLLAPFETFGATIAERLKGRILLQVEQNGEAWYVHPKSLQRHFLNRPADAFTIMRTLGVGITDADIKKIAVSLVHENDSDTDGDGLSDIFEDGLGTDKNNRDTDGDGYDDKTEIQNGYNPNGAGSIAYDSSFANAQKGKILLQVQRHGEAWYVNPVDGKRYFLGRPADAFAIMRKLGLGITTKDLQSIQQAGGTTSVSSSAPSSTPTTITLEAGIYESKTISVNNESFDVLLATLPKNSYEMKTLTGQNNDCDHDCVAKPLADYVNSVGGVVGIHGSYFCPPDYSACSDKTYSYVSPFYNSQSGIMVNEYKMPFHEGPMVTYDASGQYKLFHRPLEIGWTAGEYQTKFGSSLRAALSNYPSIIENGVRVLESEPTLSPALRDNKSPRGVLGWDDTNMYVLIVKRGTLPDVASLAQKIGMKNAINLDGGGTTAMYVKGSYVIGPGRLLPNAIVFVKK